MNRFLISGVFFFLSILYAEARQVTGSVKCGKEKIANVVVTDGTNFAVTGRNGKFRMDIADDADFVYIVTPSGYTADCSAGTPVFYLPADDRNSYDFVLQRTSDSKDYTLVAIADPQMSTEKHVKRFRDRMLPDLEATVSGYAQGLVAGIALGDICWDRKEIYEGYKEDIAGLGIPFYPVIGNHDHRKDLKGDKVTSGSYRDAFGPENYAFAIGDDYVVVLDNIIYDTEKKYEEGYTESQLKWLETLLSYFPEDAGIYVGIHAPNRFPLYGRRILNEEKLISVLSGRNVVILSGHTHVNNNFTHAAGIVEHNIAACCGSWWAADHCTDGTPGGFKVFEKRDGKLSWYYKSVGHDKDFQVEIFMPGQSVRHPNSVIANVWDYDPEWSVEWYEDGKPMGPMKQVTDYSPIYQREILKAYKGDADRIPGYKRPDSNMHYFSAVPGQYAKTVTVVVKSRFGKEWRYDVDMRGYVDVQAHRGGAGLMPENTIQSMKNALDMGVNTLELDLQISADGQVVVSHDAYFHSRYATRPDGTIVKPEDPKEYIYTMPYSDVRKYDTGLRESTVWPGKANIAAYKPLADELIDFVENYVAENSLSPVRYNIEIKSKSGKHEGKNWPEYHEFVDKCVELLLSKELGDRLVVQCFDTRALNYMHEKYPELELSYLIGGNERDFEAYMGRLDFTPHWLSPHYSIVDAELCRKVWDKGMKIVPWTVDEADDISRMIDLKVDAIISNYPDRVLKQTRGF